MNRGTLFILVVLINIQMKVMCQMNFLDDENLGETRRTKFQLDFEALDQIRKTKNPELRSSTSEEVFKPTFSNSKMPRRFYSYNE